MKEIPLKKLAREAITQMRTSIYTVLFSNPVGKGWFGKYMGKQEGMTILANARALDVGLFPSSPDEIGYTSVIITPEMVGKRVAIFTAIEWKKPGEVTGKTNEQIQRKYPEQYKFVRTLQNAGAIADILDSIEDGILLCRDVRIGGLYKR